METAEEFATRYLLAIRADTDEVPALADDIRVRDNATRLAAKLEGANEVLDELARVAGEMRWNDDRQMLTGIYKMLCLKYRAEAQPQSDEKR